MAREDGPGGTRLVAYVVAAAPDAGELRERSPGERLPEYMVPAAFVLLRRSCRSRRTARWTGAALPGPGARAPSATEATARRGRPIEELLAGIWAEVLGLERVGVHDDFFDLGGHSLLATQVVVAGARRPSASSCRCASLFEAPTVAALAATARGGAAAGDGGAAPAARARAARRRAAAVLRPAAALVPRPARAGQRRLQHPVGAAPRGRARRGARCAGALTRDRAAPRGAAHDLRRPEDGRAVQVVAPGAARCRCRWSTCAACRTPSAQSEARRLAQEEARRPFDLARGPLLRATLLRAGDRRSTCCCSPCTTSCPTAGRWACCPRAGGALRALSRRASRRRCRSCRSSTPTSRVWQRGWLQGEVLERQLAYWREQLAGAPPALELPTDRPRPAGADLPRRRRARCAVPRAPGEALRGAVPARGRHAVHGPAGRLPGAARPLHRPGRRRRGHADREPQPARDRGARSGSSSTPWCCAPTCRATRASASCWRGCARRRSAPTPTRTCRSRSWSRSCSPSATSASNPLFQVMFALQNAPRRALELPGLHARAVRHATAPRRKFDLELHVFERERRRSSAALFEYNTDLFDAATVERLARPLAERCCEAAVARSGGAALGAAAADGRPSGSSSCVEWNGTARGLPAGVDASTSCSRRRRRATPDAVAVRLRRARADLRRAEPAGEPAGPPPARAGRGPGGRWWGSASSARSSWSWGSWRS